MAVDQDPRPRGSVALAVAAAAVTVAVGVTFAALGGYLTPRRDVASQGAVVEAPAPRVQEPQVPGAIGPAGPSIVLVPVQPDPRAQPAATPPAPELLLAVDPAIAGGGVAYADDRAAPYRDYEDDDDDDDDEAREHGRRRAHHGHDDEDDDD